MLEKIKSFFKHSETILIARLQYVAGLLIFVISTIDHTLLSVYIPAKWVPVWLIFAGLVTEWARRRKGHSFRDTEQD